MSLFGFTRSNKELDDYLLVWKVYGASSSETREAVVARASLLYKEELIALKMSVLLLVDKAPGTTALQKLWALHSTLRPGQISTLGETSRYSNELTVQQAAAATLLRMALSEAYITLAEANGRAMTVSPLMSVDKLAEGCREFELSLFRGNSVTKTQGLHTMEVKPPKGVVPTVKPSGVDEQVLDLIQSGQHVLAVKLVRDHYQMPLAEAKRFVDELREDATPTKPTGSAPSSSVGAGLHCVSCSRVILDYHYDFESILMNPWIAGQCRGCGIVICEDHYSQWTDKDGKKWCPKCGAKAVWVCDGRAYSSMVDQEGRAGSYNEHIRPPAGNRSIVQE